MKFSNAEDLAASAQIEEVHPGWEDLVSSKDFKSWVLKSLRRCQIVLEGTIEESIALLSEYKEDRFS